MLLSMRALLAQLLPFISLVDVYASSLAAPVIKLDIGPFRGSTVNREILQRDSRGPNLTGAKWRLAPSLSLAVWPR